MRSSGCYAFCRLLCCGLAVLCWLVSCTSDDGGDSATITLKSSAAIELPSVTGQEASLAFESSARWVATCKADWLTISPERGEKGSNSITLTTTAPNRTKATRSAQLTITSGSASKQVTVVQSDKYAVFGSKEYTVGSEGGIVALDATSNIVHNELQIGYGGETWIDFANAGTRGSDWQGQVPVSIAPNTSASARTAAFFLITSDGSNDDWLVYDTTYVKQAGISGDYVSTDYSADGTVSIMQQASRGKGIPIVLMGDGFADCDIADGTYEKVMEKAVENMFSEEPVKSLRDYFDIYRVTAVSRNGCIGSEYSTVFSCVPSINSTDIECNDKKVMEYMSKVANINMEEALAVVILNAETYNGVTYLYNNDNGQPTQFAIALCPVINGIDSETFRQVLVHEAIGHGLGKLADEYGYSSNGSISEDNAKQLETFHRYNWMTNVDINSSPERVTWSSFIGDGSFSNESIGVYEGAYTFTSGVYRPTKESMMRSNDCPFNAPSRKAIYDRVMLLGERRSTSTHETFSAFDEQHKPAQWSYSDTRGQQEQRRFAPPRIKPFAKSYSK